MTAVAEMMVSVAPDCQKKRVVRQKMTGKFFGDNKMWNVLYDPAYADELAKMANVNSSALGHMVRANEWNAAGGRREVDPYKDDECLAVARITDETLQVSRRRVFGT